MIKKIKQKLKGSVALVSVLTVSALVIILVVAMSEINISTSYQHFNNSSSKISYYIGESCLEEAIKRLEDDSTFTNETITLDADTNCTVNVSGNTLAITANYLNFTQNYQATITQTTQGQANNVQLTSWKEI